eukprot:3660864-Rhodomonas_salina.1
MKASSMFNLASLGAVFVGFLAAMVSFYDKFGTSLWEVVEKNQFLSPRVSFAISRIRAPGITCHARRQTPSSRRWDTLGSRSA